MLNRLFPGVKFIYLYRRNKMQQAISLVKANQSQFVRGDIEQAILHYAIWEARCREFFNKYNITPLFITYESLRDDKVKVISKVLDFLEIDPKESRSLKEQIRDVKLSPRLWNHVNEAWYRKMVGYV